MTAPDLRAQIAGEIYIALERLGADEELLAIVGSWRDTLNDDEIVNRTYSTPAGISPLGQQLTFARQRCPQWSLPL